MDKIANYVYETYDYDMFRIMDKGNRAIDHDKKIATSMNANFLFSPILVNEKMEIIDGQNRFMAAKSLGKPIYYIVKDGYGLDEVRTLNTNSKNWDKNNFIKSYADEGKEEYVKIVKLMKKYPDFKIAVIETILRLSSGCYSYELKENNIKDGTFKAVNWEKSEHILQMLMAYKPFHKDIYKRRSFIYAIIRLSRDPQFDNDELIRKIKLNPRAFVPCVNTADTISMIENIVNYRRRDRIRFNV